MLNDQLWNDNHVRLFLSHVSSHKSLAMQLKAELLKYEIAAFVAHKDIEPSKEWQDEIESAIKTADGLVAIMSPNFHRSKWTDQEVGVAVGRHKLIIPILLGRSPYGFLNKVQYLNGKKRSAAWLASQVLRIVLADKTVSQKMARRLVRRFAQSYSFADARDNLALLGKIQFWDSELLNVVKKAVKQNNQISYTFRVKPNVLSLMKRVEENLKSKRKERRKRGSLKIVSGGTIIR